jgi:putative superfamily III holin-X
MATLHEFPTRDAHEEALLARLTRLVRLELELGLAETRALVRTLVIAAALAVPSAILMLAAIVVLVAAALAPLFGAAWQHLLIAGGGVLLLALTCIAWAVWRVTHLEWPRETIRSFEENKRWLAAQLRSRLTLR